MKRFYACAVFLVVSAFSKNGFGAEDYALWIAEDSSVGKNPHALLDPSPARSLSGLQSTYGRVPTSFILDGLPPRSSGPSLRTDPKVTFFVYSDEHAPQNHFIPSGWMGDYGDLRLDERSQDDPADGKTCMKISYSGQGAQSMGWAGMYWQEPRNNWGDKAGGFNLSGMKRVTFWARGAKGGEEIASFKVGGISGLHHDTGSAEIGPIVLTQDWKQYVIDLSDMDLSHIAGGFAWAASAQANPAGMTFYLDNIRFEQ